MAHPIEFYQMPESNACRIVEMVANILEVPLNKHHIDLLTGDNLKEDFLRLNPRHKVPYIVDGNLKMGESRAIATYLVNAYKPNHSIYPSDPKVRARIDELLYFDAGTVNATAVKLFRPKMFGAKELNREDEQAYRDNLRYLDRMVATSKSKFILGTDHLTLADISVVACASTPYTCDYSLNEFKHLAAYLELMRLEIPNYSEINDIPIERMRAFIRATQAQVSTHCMK